MKKSNEPSRGEMNKASTTEAKLNSKAEYVEKLRKDNEVRICTYVAICMYTLSKYVIIHTHYVNKHLLHNVFSWLPI